MITGPRDFGRHPLEGDFLELPECAGGTWVCAVSKICAVDITARHELFPSRELSGNAQKSQSYIHSNHLASICLRDFPPSPFFSSDFRPNTTAQVFNICAFCAFQRVVPRRRRRWLLFVLPVVLLVVPVTDLNVSFENTKRSRIRNLEFAILVRKS